MPLFFWIVMTAMFRAISSEPWPGLRRVPTLADWLERKETR